MKNSTLCYIRKDDKTLMLFRNKKKNDVHEGKWVGLGGKMESGESPEDCLLREVKEEAGIELLDYKLKGILSFPKFSNGEDWYVFLYEAYDFKGKITSSCEGQLEWIADYEIKNLNLWEGDRLFLNWMDKDEFFSGKIVYRNSELQDYEVNFY